MSRITSLIDWSTGVMWLISATIPIVPSTAVIASTSGIIAATSAPKVTSRINSVIGSEVSSARWKSSLITSEICFDALAWPNWPIANPAWAACAAPVAFNVAATRSSTSLSLPASWNCSSAECPSVEMRAWLPGAYGLSKFFVYGTATSRRCTSATTARNAGAVAA